MINAIENLTINDSRSRGKIGLDTFASDFDLKKLTYEEIVKLLDYAEIFSRYLMRSAFEDLPRDFLLWFLENKLNQDLYNELITHPLFVEKVLLNEVLKDDDYFHEYLQAVVRGVLYIIAQTPLTIDNLLIDVFQLTKKAK
jgi:uncharacterized protein (DUF3820 family)